jgi:hypothetical protein
MGANRELALLMNEGTLGHGQLWDELFPGEKEWIVSSPDS